MFLWWLGGALELVPLNRPSAVEDQVQGLATNPPPSYSVIVSPSHLLPQPFQENIQIGLLWASCNSTPSAATGRPVQTDYDGAEPGAGSVAADNLLRLSGYFGGEEGKVLREKAAEQLAAAFALPETPQAYPELTASLVTALLGPKQV